MSTLRDTSQLRKGEGAKGAPRDSFDSPDRVGESCVDTSNSSLDVESGASERGRDEKLSFLCSAEMKGQRLHRCGCGKTDAMSRSRLPWMARFMRQRNNERYMSTMKIAIASIPTNPRSRTSAAPSTMACTALTFISLTPSAI